MFTTDHTTTTGLKINVRPSPNFNDRPSGVNIDCIVIHYTDYLNFDDFLACHLDPESKLSAHYLINDDGTIYQLVADDKRAWHAGVSHWRGRDNVNNNSIGIELHNGGMTYKEKFREWPPYPAIQIDALAKLIFELQNRHSIPTNHIIGHNDVAPTRKIDPGPHFDWNDLRSRLSYLHTTNNN